MKSQVVQPSGWITSGTAKPRELTPHFKTWIISCITAPLDVIPVFFEWLLCGGWFTAEAHWRNIFFDHYKF